MDELIKITKQNIGPEEVNAVDARELHAFLESKQEFATWIKNRIKQYGFVQGTDFIKFDNFIKSDSKARIEYALSLDMAKELSMVERNVKGKEARQYFIQCEKIAKGKIRNEAHLPDYVEAQMIAVKYAADILRVSDVGKVIMLKKTLEMNNLPSDMLPVYVENTKPTFAAKVLLDKYDCGISTIAFNKLMVASGFMEEKQRPSTKTKDKIKKFKSLTDAGLQYGQNNTSPQNSRETQPHYFEDTFMDLFGKLNQEAEAA